MLKLPTKQNSTCYYEAAREQLSHTVHISMRMGTIYAILIFFYPQTIINSSLPWLMQFNFCGYAVLGHSLIFKLHSSIT